MPFHSWRETPKDYHGRHCDVKVITGDRLQLCLAEIWRPGEYVIHHHPHEQFGYLLRGSVRMTLGDEERLIVPGDVWHVPPNVEHGGQIIGDDNILFLDVFHPVREDLLDPDRHYGRATSDQPRRSDHL
jgi:quercetin dioxygenase-like cupin family protein